MKCISCRFAADESEVVPIAVEIEVAVPGPKGKHNPDRTAYRQGYQSTTIPMGNQCLAIERPRLRCTVKNQELPIPSYEAFANDEQLIEAALAAKYGINPVVLSRWKKEFLERAPEIFKKGSSETEKELEYSKGHIAELERKVGQLTYEVDWLKKKSTQILGPDWKKKMR